MGMGLLARPCVLAAVLASGALVAGCGSARTTSSTTIPTALIREARPVGRGARFQPPATGRVIGPCLKSLGARYGVHVELFAANRVVLIPAGIGTRRPRTLLNGRIARARCYGALVTVDPTGVLLVSDRRALSIAGLFRSWGQPLSNTRLASFSGERVEVFVDGRRWGGPPGAVPLKRHAEIVLEVGPHVPPHAAYTFPPGT